MPFSRSAAATRKLKKRVLQQAADLTKRQGADDFAVVDYLFNQMVGVIEGNEMMALLDVVKPLYERQPAYVGVMQRWMQQRVYCLQQAGQADQALDLQRAMAEKWPRNWNLQQQYAQALANSGNYEAAYAWLDRALASDLPRQPYEEESLRSTYAKLASEPGPLCGAGQVRGHLDQTKSRRIHRLSAVSVRAGSLRSSGRSGQNHCEVACRRADRRPAATGHGRATSGRRATGVGVWI